MQRLKLIMRSTQFLILTSIILWPALCYSQGEELVARMIPKPVPPSPNVAGLGKYGDYQVSHFTGIPEISIPIFEAKSGSLSVPITLSYHASGIKPTDVASWVGSGWSLSAGGQISRTVNGKPDEEHYFTHPLNAMPTNCFSFVYLKQAATFNDTEPDVFSYSYPGRNGKFIIPNAGTYVNENSTGPMGKPYLFPYAPIVINRVTGDKYEITDENGVLYRFGTNGLGVASTEFTNSFNGGTQSLHATTGWNLMDMEAPNSDDKMLFSYQDVGQAYRKDVSYSYLIRDRCFVNNGASCPAASHLSAQKVSNENDVNQQGLESITFENGKVEFVLGNMPRTDASELKYLDKIIVKSLVNGSYTTVKTVQFLYSYFNDGNGNIAALKLDGVHFTDNSNVSIQKYRFTYFTDSFSWNRTHLNFWNARDLWGYYNGALTNEDLVLPRDVEYQASEGSTPYNISIGKAYNRNVNPSYIKEGVLSRIDFPTGGYTEFDYESNKYLNDQSVATAAGGLRVTKITSKDSPAGVPVVKTYKYGASESGVGKALFTSNQFNYSATHLYATICFGIDPWLALRIRTIHSNTAFSPDSPSPVVYPYVTEYFGDPSGNINGKIFYEFDGGFPAADVDHVVGPSTKYFKNNFSWRRGKLTNKTVFDHVGNKISETQIQYSTFKEEGKLVGLGVYEFKSGDPDCTLGTRCFNEYGDWVDDQTYKFAGYSQNSGALMETQVHEYQYERGNPTKYVVTSTIKTYDSTKLQVLQFARTSSNSTEKAVTVNTYPFQLTAANSSSTGPARGIYLLNNKNILSMPVESYTFLQKPDSTNRRIVSGQVTTYKQNPANSNYVVPDQIYVWESATRVSSYLPIAINGSNNGVTFNTNQKPRISSMNYDQYGNLQSVSKTNDVLVSYKWGYNNSLPIAEITNALPKNVFYTSFEDETTNFSFGSKTGTKSSVISAYNKSISGLDPGDYILAYYKFVSPAWIYTETPVVVPANGLYTIALPAGQYDEIRFYPKAAQIKTYTYNPIVGMKTETDANGLTTFYDYDSLGRLKLIRDNNDHILKTYEYHYKIMN